MLQAHSFLWHYLWVAPNVLLLALALVLWRRGASRSFPAFIAFAAICSVGELVAYLSDVLPFITPETYWRISWGNLILAGILKFILIGEIFAQVFESYSSLANLGKTLIRGAGVILVFASGVAAASAPKYEFFGIISGANLLEQSTYLIESGLLLFIFVIVSYFGLRWSQPLFGIAFGLSLSACVHLTSWALLANTGLPYSKRILFVFLNMGVYHACVLIWFFFLLVPGKVRANSAIPVPEHNLEVWNREVGRLLHQ